MWKREAEESVLEWCDGRDSTAFATFEDEKNGNPKESRQSLPTEKAREQILPERKTAL